MKNDILMFSSVQFLDMNRIVGMRSIQLLFRESLTAVLWFVLKAEAADQNTTCSMTLKVTGTQCSHPLTGPPTESPLMDCECCGIKCLKHDHHDHHVDRGVGKLPRFIRIYKMHPARADGSLPPQARADRSKIRGLLMAWGEVCVWFSTPACSSYWYITMQVLQGLKCMTCIHYCGFI